MKTAAKLPFNPGLAGPFAFGSVVYASTGAPYPSQTNLFKNFWVYNNPSKDYAIERRLDYTAFFSEVASTNWPFRADNVPLNGYVFIPRGEGPFPLAVLVHGTHGNVSDNSATGYFYLCELLASHGIIAVTIDLMFAGHPFPYFDELNQYAMGMEYGARGVLVLEHVKQLGQWNAQIGHPLQDKVDMEHIMLMGHSRGGEAVLDASYINQKTVMNGGPAHPDIPLNDPEKFGPYGFNLSVLVGVAATSGQDFRQYGYRVPAPHHYFMIRGTRDKDVPLNLSCETYLMSPLRKTRLEGGGINPLEKGHWEIDGGNHNYFNTVWQAVDMKASPKAAAITPEQQQAIAKVYIGAIAQRYLLEKPAFDALLQDHSLAQVNGWLGDGRITSEYHHHQCLPVQTQQEHTGAPQISAPLLGTVETHGNLRAKRGVLALGPGFHFSYIVLTLEWFELNARYSLNLTTAPLPLEQYSVLSLNVAVARDTLNDANREGLGFSIVIRSPQGSAHFSTRDFHILHYPDSNPDTPASANQFLLFQTIRLPLTAIAEHLSDVSAINQIELVFDQHPCGAIHCGEIQFSQ